MQAKGRNLLKTGTPQAFHCLSKSPSASNTNCLPVLQQPAMSAAGTGKFCQQTQGFHGLKAALGGVLGRVMG